MERFYRKMIFPILSFCVLLIFVFPTVAEIIPFQKNEDGKYYSAKDTSVSSSPDPKEAPGVICRGIDLSYHNGQVDFDEIAKQYQNGEISFVILRCGYGQDQTSQDDSKWKSYADACKKRKIPFGAYIYSYATTKSGAIGEAKHALRLVKGYDLTYPIYIDIEDNRQADLTAGQFEAVVDGFCQTILDAGYETGVVSKYTWFSNKNQLGSIDYAGKHYNKWVSRYNNVLNKEGQTLTCDIWQCTQSGQVAGVTGKVDIDFSYMEERTTDHCYVTFHTGRSVVTVPSPMHLKVGDKLGTLPTVKQPDGTESVGWYTSEIGGSEANAETTVEAGGQLRLYARWPIEVNFTLHHATATSGSLLQKIKSGTELSTITVEPEEGYYLPKEMKDLPTGLNWTWINYQKATVSGTAITSLSLPLSATEKESQSAPLSELLTQSAVTYQSKDGVIYGLDESMEIKVGENWHRITSSEQRDGLSGLSAGNYPIRYAETDTKKAGSELQYRLKERAKTPQQDDFTVQQPNLDHAFGAVTPHDSGFEISTNGGKTYQPIITEANQLTGWKSVLIRKCETNETAPSLPIRIDIVPMNGTDAIDYLQFRIQTNTPTTAFFIGGEATLSDTDGWVLLTEGMLGTELTIEKADHSDSDEKVTVTLSIPQRPATPAIQAISETYIGQGNGKFKGLTEEMEISEDGGFHWEPADPNAKFETGKEYRFRIPADQESKHFESREVMAIIETGRPIRVIFKAEGVGEIIMETEYQGTVRVPELPKRDGANMKKSHWKIDLTDVMLTEDQTVESEYVPSGCAATVVSGLFFFPTLLLPVFSKRKKRKY